ncbi:MAG: cytochrome C [Betaproteobacteria bacterium CG2_30_59_46]|nr:MAG: cytochrome C [Betaproteobacteria bacterium CG2_30_59_46]PIQ13967.1 MAG: cytochrome C [Hydrogenophilales bacterium CG18_big_fil_WC_8_21_14_2_50_58_12]PIY01032.1 MAG: cytochrome C [Hydrogenophilales bacterium CG_4_10_14_3_um_filter_58_23]PJB04747.1 MAG: cytochrome C [Hydrogenophilales bacterium CG_4_9_14_3_um_filter_59_35]
MKKVLVAALALALAPTVVSAATAELHKEGIASKGYVWNEQAGEKIEALKLRGDSVRGKDAYEVCGACHLPSGSGRPDGTFPQLAGQHATVIIKQIADIRGGLRDNPTMYPFAVTLSNAQELADVATYIQTLCIPREHGMGSKNPAILKHGEELYKKECTTCHGVTGAGDKAKFYPVLAGQHYKYMLRQVTDIRDGKRRNANPDMVKIVKKYSDHDLDSVVTYMSTLTMPGTLCAEKKGAGKKKK